MDTWVTVFLALGVMLRLTRLISQDTITQPLRDRFSGWFLTLITCGWCLSMWLSVPIAVSWWYWSSQPWWQIAALSLTGSWICGWLQFAGSPARHEILPVGVLPVLHEIPSHTNMTVLVEPETQLDNDGK